MRNEEPSAVGDDERMTLMALAGDLPALWNDAAASIGTRKRILRAVLKEIIVTAETGRLHLVLHWQGGDHTRLEVLKNRSGQTCYKTDAATEQMVCEPDHTPRRRPQSACRTARRSPAFAAGFDCSRAIPGFHRHEIALHAVHGPQAASHRPLLEELHRIDQGAVIPQRSGIPTKPHASANFSGAVPRLSERGVPSGRGSS